MALSKLKFSYLINDVIGSGLSISYNLFEITKEIHKKTHKQLICTSSRNQITMVLHQAPPLGCHMDRPLAPGNGQKSMKWINQIETDKL